MKRKSSSSSSSSSSHNRLFLSDQSKKIKLQSNVFQSLNPSELITRKEKMLKELKQMDKSESLYMAKSMILKNKIRKLDEEIYRSKIRMKNYEVLDEEEEEEVNTTPFVSNRNEISRSILPDVEKQFKKHVNIFKLKTDSRIRGLKKKKSILSGIHIEDIDYNADQCKNCGSQDMFLDLNSANQVCKHCDQSSPFMTHLLDTKEPTEKNSSSKMSSGDKQHIKRHVLQFCSDTPNPTDIVLNQFHTGYQHFYNDDPYIIKNKTTELIMKSSTEFKDWYGKIKKVHVVTPERMSRYISCTNVPGFSRADIHKILELREKYIKSQELYDDDDDDDVDKKNSNINCAVMFKQLGSLLGCKQARLMNSPNTFNINYRHISEFDKISRLNPL